MKINTQIILILFLTTFNITLSDSLSSTKEIDNINVRILNLESKIDSMQSKNTKILNENESIKKSLEIFVKDYQLIISDVEAYKKATRSKIDSLQKVVFSNSVNIKTTADELGVKIKDSQNFTNQSITDLNKTVSQNTLYWIIAFLLVAIFVLLVFVSLRKQIFKQKTDLNRNLNDTRKVLEEEGVKLDNKLIEVLETQLKIINSSNSNSENEADHSLALKVADEIIRIQKNLSRMDEKTKGLKQLTASVKRIQDNFVSNGYELVDMLGKKYHDGMRVSANFIPDDDLKSGEQIITRIIKPQVNYRGIMIQSAQIEVSQG